MNEVVFVSAVRTAVGDFLGSLKDLSSVETGALVLKSAMEKVNLAPNLVEEVVCGNPDMAGQNRTPDGRSPYTPAVRGKPLRAR